MKILPRYLHHHHMNSLDHPLLHIRHFPHSLIIFLSQLLHHQKVNIAHGHMFQDVLIQKKSS